MSSRLATAAEMTEVTQVVWRPLHVEAPPDPVEQPESDPAVVEALREELAAAENAVRSLDERIQELETERQVKSQESYLHGLQEGRANAAREMEAAYNSSVERMGRSIAELGGFRHRLRREAEADVVRLALNIAKKILKKQLAVDREAVEGAVAAGIEKLRSAELLKVQVHPKQAGAVRDQLIRLGITGVPVESSPSLDEGAVLIESTRGGIDASLETQLREVENAFAARLD